ncbi:MAG: hypothetical protein MJ201_02050 [Mycoplasmoidaceae bacterium]|nr:hypothetical protein [Mycoplasmoidaceae bacterium]
MKANIKELHQLPDEIIFAIESSTVKNKIFSELKIQIVKATAVTKKAKTAMVQKLLAKAKIKLDPVAEDLLVNLLPDNIHFIMNEVEKLKLMNQKTFNVDEIKEIVFDIGDATVFNIVDS